MKKYQKLLNFLCTCLRINRTICTCLSLTGVALYHLGIHLYHSRPLAISIHYLRGAAPNHICPLCCRN